MENKKLKVVFPFVEAGLGHIMTEKAICDAFEKKYGEYFEIVRTNFYTEVGTKPAKNFETFMCNSVKKYNKTNVLGYLSTFMLKLFGMRISSMMTMKYRIKGSYKDSMAYMEKLNPDVVISTHWATNYYAWHLKRKPYTIVYVPDCHVNAFFRYFCDLTLVNTEEGLKKAKKHKTRYNDDNIKLTSFAIRGEAFEIKESKAELRKKLGHDDKFTVYITDGGYGIGMAEKLSNLLIEKDLNISVIVVCGKNPELYERLKNIKTGKNISFYPYEYAPNAIEMIASSDIYFGKSGNGLMEAAYFNVPIVVTHSANNIEKRIADHYVKYVGDAVRIFDVNKCLDFIVDIINGNNETYNKLKAVEIDKTRFGGEYIADLIFEEINRKYHIK